jgi:hypothetical protein
VPTDRGSNPRTSTTQQSTRPIISGCDDGGRATRASVRQLSMLRSDYRMSLRHFAVVLG